MSTASPARSPIRRSLALGVSLCVATSAQLGVAVPAAHAGPAGRAAAPAADPELDEARRLYDEGKARFDTFDYEGAVDAWTRAYAKLPPDAASIRNSLAYNIATAQEKAFELDHDVQHLRQAVKLLESYIENYKALYERTDETAAEVDKAEQRIAMLEERIEEASEAGDRPPPAVDGEPSADEPADGDDTPPVPPGNPELMEKNRRLAAQERKTDRLLIGSYVTLSVGGLFLLLGVSTLAGANAIEASDTDDEPLDPTIDDDEPTDAEATAGVVRGSGYGLLGIGLAGVAAGFTLLGIGLDRRKKARNGTLVSGGPMLGRGLAGASIHVRF